MNRRRFVWTTVLFSCAAFAANEVERPAIEFSRGSDGSLQMAAADCEVIRVQVNGLRKWTEQLGERTGSDPEISNGSGGKCFVNLNGSVPKFVLENHGKSGPHSGPNCHNLVLLMNKLVPDFRATSGEELNHWLLSPLCEEKRPTDSPEENEIIVWWSGGGAQHSQIFIPPYLAFDKLSTHQNTPYQLRTYRNSQHDKSFEYPRGFGEQPGDGPVKRHFKCHSLDEFSKTLPHSNSAYGLRKSVEKIECQFGSGLRSSTMTTQSLNLIEKTLPILESVARAELLRLSQNSNNDQSVKTEIIVRGILLRIGSIRDQLRFSRDDLDGKPHLWKEIDIDAIIQKQKETSYQ